MLSDRFFLMLTYSFPIISFIYSPRWLTCIYKGYLSSYSSQMLNRYVSCVANVLKALIAIQERPSTKAF